MLAVKVVGILALQGDFEAHSRIVSSLGAEAREVRVPSDLDGLDALILPGGPQPAQVREHRRRASLDERPGERAGAAGELERGEPVDRPQRHLER